MTSEKYEGGCWDVTSGKRKEQDAYPRHKATHNPIPTSLFCFNMFLFVCLFVRQSKQHDILTNENVCCCLGRTKM